MRRRLRTLPEAVRIRARLRAYEAIGEREEWVAQHLTRFVRRRRTATRDIIMVAGFAWSGSSAVVDLLREHTRAMRPPGGEIKLLEALARLVEEPWVRSPGREALLCGRVTDDLRRESDRAARLERKFDFLFSQKLSFPKVEFEHRAQDILDDLRAVGLGRVAVGEELDLAATRAACTEYFMLLHELVQRRRHVALYDNLLHAHRLSFLKYLELSRLPQVHVVVVDRDPRDQFFELMKQGRYRSQDARRFVADFMRRRRAYQEFAAQHLEAYVWHVQFEELVDPDSSLPRKLRSYFSPVLAKEFRTGRWRTGTHFRPEKSINNVGKWRHDEDQAPYRIIEDVLEEWCVQDRNGAYI